MPDTQELIEALEPCPWCRGQAVLRKDDDPGYPFYVTFDHADVCPMYAVPTDMFRSYATEAEAIAAWNTRARSADEQPTPPHDLVEEEALQRAVEAVAKIEMDREGYPLSRTQEEIYTDACETVSAVLQALSPHLSEREKIVTWLRSSQRKVLAGDDWDEGWNHAFDVAAIAISRGDHISGEGR